MTARLAAITAVRLTTAEPARLARFYAAIGFRVGEAAPIARDELDLLELQGAGTRIPMELGAQQVDLDCFELPGRAYPPGSTAADPWFQHFAIVTDDAAAAWGCARAAGAHPISRGGAVTLPASSGGVTAVKFRDPEGHPVEFLQFPDPARTAWRGSGMLGIDHVAISVRDVAASRRFYEAQGLVAGDHSLNEGTAQAALDGLDRPEVDVLALQPPATPPHLELLGYRTPPRPDALALHANDVAATRIVWAADRDALLRDPDGHLHLLRR